MPDERGQPRRQLAAEAFEAVDGWLHRVAGGRRLSPSELAAYPRRVPVAGWRVPVSFSDRRRALDVLLSHRFPREAPRIGIVGPSMALEWPHVERDNVLCLMPDGAEVSPYEPLKVVQNLIGQACTTIERSIRGETIDEFYAEFESYWAWGAHERAPLLFSLMGPETGSRLVKVWRGQGFYLVGDDEAMMQTWLRAYGAKEPTAGFAIANAAAVWLEKPLAPREFPSTGRDVVRLAEERAAEAVPLLERLAHAVPDRIVALLMARGPDGGTACAGVVVDRPHPLPRGPGRSTDPITRGFRPSRVDSGVAATRYFGGGSLMRTQVERADPAWIHGRGQDPRAATLRGKTVLILGCGSVGAPVAIALAQAGVGRLLLVDPDTLKWANIGRHPLGAQSVGLEKASELALHIRSRLPHVTAASFSARLEDLLGTRPELFFHADLIVSVTGSWAGEGALNAWHVEGGRTRPILYGWTEAHACAGQGVVICGQEGCLACGLSATGVPSFRVTRWTENTTLREPGCGATFQPYGPVELGHVNDTLAELALDCLLGEIEGSTHRIWAARRKLLEQAGGEWTLDFEQLAGRGSRGGLLLERRWAPAELCPVCSRAAAAA